VLDHPGRPFPRVAGILAEFFTRAPLAQKIPEPIELDVDFVEAPPVVGTKGAALVEKRTLFGDERFDVLLKLLVVHIRNVPAANASLTVQHVRETNYCVRGEHAIEIAWRSTKRDSR